jgi:ubiquinone/menaquinone biosynthesis C-methylase UbiE
MEHEEESLRLEMKTKPEMVEEQAKFAGIESGMRVLDVGCGIGKTTSILHKIVQPGGKTIGIDISESRIQYASRYYEREGIEFVRKDILNPLDDLGEFDFIWMRFVLEYFKAEAWSIVQNVTRALKPRGTLCLIDLDHNCLNHFEMPERLERTLMELAELFEAEANFDPYAGRKLYSYLYKMGFVDIKVHVSAHHLIYQELSDVDAYNWLKKMEIGVKKMNFDFRHYSSGHEGFVEEFMTFFNDPGRFTYTPLIAVHGRKPDKTKTAEAQPRSGQANTDT